MFKEKLHYIVLVLLCLVFTNRLSLQAQEITCPSDEHLEFQRLIYPDLNQKLQQIAQHTRQVLRYVNLRNDETILIPVVFHIVYEDDADNLPLWVIESQLAVLNEDFQRLNQDQDDQWPQAGNPKISFVLAAYDPEGNPSSGIIRIKTDSTSFRRHNDPIKFNHSGGSDAWPATDYLNIWVGNLEGNYLGYAQFPGGGRDSTDGIVINTRNFGRTSDTQLGRTATHEVGHWLNLNHIWGIGCGIDDGVADTPDAAYPSYGCQLNKHTCGSLDMVKNFMDLSNDNCMNLFTQGQVDRMRAQFAPGGFRESILHSIGLDPKSEDDDPQEEACPAPYDLFITLNQGYFLASWKGSADEYIFQIKLPVFNQWIEIAHTQTSMSGYIPGFNSFEARVKSICGEEESNWSIFPVSTVSQRARLSTIDMFHLSPNPAHDQVSIEWPLVDYISANGQPKLQAPSRNVQLDIFNLNGQHLFQQEYDWYDGMASFVINDWSPGIYFAVLSDQNGQVIYRTKMIKQ